MQTKKYLVCKNKKEKEIVYIDFDKLKGYNFSPKKGINEGISINKMIIIKPSLIEKILKTKIKHKLDLYLKLIINFIESDDSSSDTTLREALNDLSKYKDIVLYKYRKYLDEKYLKILLKKIAILEYELNKKLVNVNEIDINKYKLDYQDEDEYTSVRRR